MVFTKKSSDSKAIGNLSLPQDHATTNKGQMGAEQGKASESVPLEPFFAGTKDSLGKHYMEITFSVEVGGAIAANIIRQKIPIIRDTVTTLLSEKTYINLASAENKLALKNEVQVAIDKAIGGNVVKRVFIVDMVLQ